MDIVPEKPCTRCGQVKPLTEFHKRASTQDGHAFQCRACQAAYDREKRAHKAARLRERYATDPVYRDRAKARHRNYYATHEKYREQSKQQTAQWQRENRERVNAGARRRWPIAKLTPQARANKKNKKYLRRARLKNAGKYTPREWRDLCAFYEHRCLCCGEQFSLDALTVDHVVPLSRGGLNTIDNLQPLCMNCNRRKNDRTADYRTLEQLRMEWEV